MLRNRDIDCAIADLADDPAARKRYPLLSQLAGWPLTDRGVANLSSSRARDEERAYWSEVYRRAVGDYVPDTCLPDAPCPCGPTAARRVDIDFDIRNSADAASSGIPV